MEIAAKKSTEWEDSFEEKIICLLGCPPFPVIVANEGLYGLPP